MFGLNVILYGGAVLSPVVTLATPEHSGLQSKYL